MEGGELEFKGVLIDLGDTLIHVDEEGNRRYREAILTTLSKHGYMSRLSDVDSTLDRLYMRSTNGEIKSLHDFWILFLNELKMPEEDGLVDDLEKVRRNWSGAMFKLYEGVILTLSILRKRYILALVSNCSIGTRDIISALSLEKFFDHMILSYEVGARKPDSRIYFQALQAMDLEARECIFVADEISDLEGAKAVGLSTFLVRQGSNTFSEANSDFKPDFQCDHVSEIVRII